MIVFPPAKINLGLQVLRLRDDGYRDIRTVMLPVPLHDVLEAIVDPALAPGEVVFTRSGRPVPGDPDQDLCARAVRQLAQRKALPGLRLHLHKVIPMGAGLGGGSSDGAHTLLLLNDLLSLELPADELHDMAAALGSDCPFFLRPGPQLAEGRGERLTPVEIKLSGWWLVVANPGVHVGTAEVYANTPLGPDAEDLIALVGSPPTAWPGRLVNDMETYVLKAYPQVAALKRSLEEAGATYAAMSGSGASVFGLFRERPGLADMDQHVVLLTRL